MIRTMRGEGGVELALGFEDFTPGRVFELGQRTLSEGEIVAFAEDWDPQPMHLDPESRAAEPLGGLIASGWQTVCVWMRMYVDQVINHAAMLAAPGVEDIRWLRPVRPGMALRGRATILDRWLSENKPGRGTIRLRGELVDDDGDPVMTMQARGHVRLSQEQRV
jgi:acyl dehydratase